MGSVVQASVPRWESGHMGGWDPGPGSKAPRDFSACPEEGVAPSSVLQPSLGLGPGSRQPERKMALSWQVELEEIICPCPQDSEGTGLPEPAA